MRSWSNVCTASAVGTGMGRTFLKPRVASSFSSTFAIRGVVCTGAIASKLLKCKPSAARSLNRPRGMQLSGMGAISCPSVVEANISLFIEEDEEGVVVGIPDIVVGEGDGNGEDDVSGVRGEGEAEDLRAGVVEEEEEEEEAAAMAEAGATPRLRAEAVAARTVRRLSRASFFIPLMDLVRMRCSTASSAASLTCPSVRWNRRASCNLRSVS